MNKNINKLKRINSKNNEKVAITQKRLRNENEKRRRDLFSQLITNLGDVISTKNNSSPNQQYKLSKNSILRQTVSYLQEHRHNLTSESKLSSSDNSCNSSEINDIVDFSWKPPFDIISIEEWFEIAIESMNCFFLIVSFDLIDSKIVYVSKNINCYLGYSQDEIVNHSLFQFIHSSNHEQLRDYLKDNHQVLKKCNVSWKQSINDQYEQCTIIGAFRKFNENEQYFISIVELNTIDRTLIMNNDYSEEQFITHINNHGRFIFINSKGRQFLGYNSFELIGRTYFDFVHPDDLPIITRAHQLWKNNGNGKSDPYRFLTKGQQWVFLQTFSQVQINSWTGKADFYICTTNVLQCSTDSLQKQLSTIPKHIQTNNSNNVDECSPVLPTTISLTRNCQEKSSSSQNEITSFLSHLDNEIYRKNIREKLVELRKIKEAEIRVRQDEIQVIEDILQFINQYQIKHPTTISINQTNNIITEEFLLNMFDTDFDSTLLNSPLSGPIEDVSVETTSKEDTINDPLALLFSPSTTFNLSSPLTPFSNSLSINDPTQDIIYLPITTMNSSMDNSLKKNTFS